MLFYMHRIIIGVIIIWGDNLHNGTGCNYLTRIINPRIQVKMKITSWCNANNIQQNTSCPRSMWRSSKSTIIYDRRWAPWAYKGMRLSTPTAHTHDGSQFDMQYMYQQCGWRCFLGHGYLMFSFADHTCSMFLSQ